MGIRSSIWLFLLLAVVGASGLVWWTSHGSAAPHRNASVITRPATEAAPSADRAEAVGAVIAALAAQTPADTPPDVEREDGARARSLAAATPGPTGVRARLMEAGATSRSRAGTPGGGAATDHIDRELERAVARFGQELDIPNLPLSRASREASLGDEAYVAGVADAAMVEFLLRQELWESFHAHSQLVPFGYPLNGIRSSLNSEIAGLSVAERNALLALVEERMPLQARPIMSMQIEYEGSDYEGSPSGVDIYE